MTRPPRAPIQLVIDRGTLLLKAPAKELEAANVPGFPGVSYDVRTLTYRAQGRHYRSIVEHCIAEKIPYADEARQWENKPLGLVLKTERTPHPYQAEAFEAWWRAGRRGTVVLPTGTGKTFLAVMAIAKVDRPTLVVTPTLDLLRQWYGQLSDYFQTEIGAVGGGDHDYRPVTVITYDSASQHVERWAHKFGFLVLDEAHHLPGATYQYIAHGALAPFRLGLTATPERADGGEGMLPDLTGPIVFRKEISEFSGDYLATYRTKLWPIDLTDEERAEYLAQKEIYRSFVTSRGISFGGVNGWQRFIFEASRSKAGWAALKAYRAQKAIERGATGKFQALEDILARHAGEQAIIFTADNATVYKIARRYLLPAITHQTKVKERKQILARFHSGEYHAVVTSQVLNEGVDVPSASVGVVLSGTGSIKENVQRLGRILRKHGEKQATLYEVIARETSEEFTSERRRQHDAFAKRASPQ